MISIIIRLIFITYLCYYFYKTGRKDGARGFIETDTLNFVDGQEYTIKCISKDINKGIGFTFTNKGVYCQFIPMEKDEEKMTLFEFKKGDKKWKK